METESGTGASPMERVVEVVLGVPVQGGNDVRLLRNGDQIFPALWTDLAAARRSIDVACFEVDDGNIPRELTDILTERAQAGVRVRVLFDPVGGRSFDRDRVEQIREAGGTFVWHDTEKLRRPGLQNYRHHRRAVVIDGRIGYAGGFGFADRWGGDAGGPDEYRDHAIRVQGPVVDGIRASFIEGWAMNGNATFDEGDDLGPQPDAGAVRATCVRASASYTWNDGATLYDALIRGATSRLRMAMGYFSPAGRAVRLLCEAAERGVQVQLVVPGPIMRRRIVKWAGEHVFDELLDGGVELYRYQPSRLHAKLVTVDGHVAVVGSINLDDRSLSLDAETGVVVFDDGVTSRLDADLDDDIAASERVVKGEWRHLGRLEMARDAAARIVNPWI